MKRKNNLNFVFTLFYSTSKYRNRDFYCDNLFSQTRNIRSEDFLLRLRRSNLKIAQLSRHARVWSLFTKAIFSDDSKLCDGTSLTVSQNCFLAATAKKLKCSIKDSCSKYVQETADLATYTEEILNGILHVLCSVERLYHSNYFFRLHSNLTSLLWFSIG